MTSRVLFFSLMALTGWLWCAAGAGAQETPPPAQPGDASSATFPGSFPWETIVIEWSEPRYKIEAMRFKARDETGVDWWGSDEVMVETTDAKGWTVSEEIGSIDSGDTHDFDPATSCIVAVRPGVVVLGKSSVCDPAGEPAPLGFEVEMWEKGLFGYPPGFCAPVPPGAGRHAGPHCADDRNGDDFIGRAQVDLPRQNLEAALPNVGDELIETVVLSPCEGGDVCGGWDFPDYTFTYRITRLADVRTDFLSQLEAAMRRSGARSRTEAVIDGLRSLRAPRPPGIAPETGNASPGNAPR